MVYEKKKRERRERSMVDRLRFAGLRPIKWIAFNWIELIFYGLGRRGLSSSPVHLHIFLSSFLHRSSDSTQIGRHGRTTVFQCNEGRASVSTISIDRRQPPIWRRPMGMGFRLQSLLPRQVSFLLLLSYWYCTSVPYPLCISLYPYQYRVLSRPPSRMVLQHPRRPLLRFP